MCGQSCGPQVKVEVAAEGRPRPSFSAMNRSTPRQGKRHHFVLAGLERLVQLVRIAACSNVERMTAHQPYQPSLDGAESLRYTSPTKGQHLQLKVPITGKLRPVQETFMKKGVFILLIFSAALPLTPGVLGAVHHQRSNVLTMGWGCRPMRCPDSDKPLELTTAALGHVLAV